MEADCAHAFRILRALLAGWIEDVRTKRSGQADALLVHLDRWLASRNSVLHYPALRRLVQSTTRRVQAQLVHELKRLGVTVVHASEHDLIITTRETDAQAAAAHVDFVTQTISAQPAFHYLSLKPRAFYGALLYLDRHNFGAIEYLDDGDVDLEARGEDEEAEPAEPVKDRFVSEWSLADPLEGAAGDWFAVLVGAFLHKPLTNRTGDAERDNIFIKNFVEEFTSQKLINVVAELQRDLEHKTAALDFVVLACRALALDERVEDEVFGGVVAVPRRASRRTPALTRSRRSRGRGACCWRS